MNKKLFKNFINDKIALEEEIYNKKFSESEKIRYEKYFLLNFERFAKIIGVDVMSIFENFDLMVELDELIEYDLDSAKKRALEVLRGA